MLNIVIPMAGNGIRFINAGYLIPKPLIKVKDKIIIQLAIKCMQNNAKINARFIYITQKKHHDVFNLKVILKNLTSNCEILTVDHLTNGAVCTTLLAEKLINNNCPLFILNSDHYIEWNLSGFMDFMKNSKVDGGIATFENNDPKYSYVKINNENNVIEVAEKKIISNTATAGIYYWSKGKDYVKYANQMINKNLRINNEFYVAPVFNEAITDNKIIKPYAVNKMWSLGTPEDLIYFLRNYQGEI